MVFILLLFIYDYQDSVKMHTHKHIRAYTHIRHKLLKRGGKHYWNITTQICENFFQVISSKVIRFGPDISFLPKKTATLLFCSKVNNECFVALPMRKNHAYKTAWRKKACINIKTKALTSAINHVRHSLEFKNIRYSSINNQQHWSFVVLLSQ